VAATANLGRSHTRGRFLLGLPSDDVLYPDALERQVELLERSAGLGFVYAYAHLVDEHGRKLPDVRAFGTDVTRKGRTVERLLQGNQIPAMTAMLRRECVEQMGEEDETLFYSDWELWVRAAAHWDVAFNPRPLAMYRVHSANTGIGIDRETNLQRSLQVTSALRERAERIGGRLAEPRVRATLELQVAFLRFAAADRPGALDGLPLAFDRDATLAGDGRWLADWLRGRMLDKLLPDGGDGFASWFVESAAPLLSGRAGDRLRREAVAASHEASAIRAAQAGERPAALRAAVGAVARSPRRLVDRRLATVLLDSVGGGRPANALRGLKRRMVGYR
jgi:hypothetical protein